MQVDRSRFLLLTAALALAACTDKTETKAEDAAKADKKAPEPAAKADEAKADEPEPVTKEFGIRGTPEPGPEGDALPPIEPDPEDESPPSPVKE